jgi:antitoxin component of MazEF toxin-antitoxin module
MQIQIGKCKDNLFVILPKQVAAQLDWGAGDLVDLEVVDGGLKAVRLVSERDRTMEIACEVMEEYRETFDALAKS